MAAGFVWGRRCIYIKTSENEQTRIFKTVALTGLATSLKWGDSMDLFAQALPASTSGCDLVAVMGGEPAEMFRKAIAEFGGMEKFVKTGRRWW